MTCHLIAHDRNSLFPLAYKIAQQALDSRQHKQHKQDFNFHLTLRAHTSYILHKAQEFVHINNQQ